MKKTMLALAAAVGIAGAAAGQPSSELDGVAVGAAENMRIAVIARRCGRWTAERFDRFLAENRTMDQWLASREDDEVTRRLAYMWLFAVQHGARIVTDVEADQRGTDICLLLQVPSNQAVLRRIERASAR